LDKKVNNKKIKIKGGENGDLEQLRNQNKKQTKKKKRRNTEDISDTKREQIK